MHLLNSESKYLITRNTTLVVCYNSNYPFMALLMVFKKNIVAINIDNFPSFIKRFGISKSPTFIFFKNGKEKKRTTDVISMMTLMERYFEND